MAEGESGSHTLSHFDAFLLTMLQIFSVPEQFWNCAEITIQPKVDDSTEAHHLSTSSTSTHATVGDKGDNTQLSTSSTSTHATVGDKGDNTHASEQALPSGKKCEKDKKDKPDTTGTDKEDHEQSSSSVSDQQAPPCNKKCKKDKKNKTGNTNNSGTNGESDSNNIASEQVSIDNKNSKKAKKKKAHGNKRDSLLPQDVVIHHQINHQYAHHEISEVKKDKNDINDSNSKEIFHHQSSHLTDHDEEVATGTVGKKKRKSRGPRHLTLNS
jgi:hypothetical protein